MSQLGGEVGGKVGGDLGNSQFPLFQSPGGVTPEQTALADYDYGQNLTQGQAQFEGSDQGGGPSLSTMATQVAGGANMGKAIDLAKLSDTDQTAAFDAFTNAQKIDQANQALETANATTAGTAVGHAAALKPTGTS